MADSAKKKAEDAEVSATPHLDGEGSAAPTEAAAHQATKCPVALCPICAAVTLLQPINPEVVEHLLNAGREFLLAAIAGLGAVAKDRSADEGGGSIEKIDIG